MAEQQYGMSNISALYEDPMQDPTQIGQPSNQDQSQNPNMVSQDELSPEVQTFLTDSYNQEMMEKFIQHNPTTLLKTLLENGAQLPHEFNRSTLTQQAQGDLTPTQSVAPIIQTQSIATPSIIQAQSMPLAAPPIVVSIPSSSSLPSIPLSNPISSILQHTSIPPPSIQPHISIPQTSLPANYVANFI